MAANDNVYQPGDLVPLEATFRNAAGALTNTTVTLTVRDPAGATTTPTPTNTSTGIYHYDYPLGTTPTAGVWEYIFAGTGAVTATERDTFVVETGSLVTSIPATALVSLADARQYVLGDITDNTQDRKLARHINAFSAAVVEYTKREWLPITLTATRRFMYPGYGLLWLGPYDLRTATAIVAYTDYPTTYQLTLAAGTTTTLGEYRLRPFGADRLTGTYRWVEIGSLPPQSGLPLWPLGNPLRPYDRSYTAFEVSITGDWGIGTVPETVKEAVLIAIDNVVKNPEGGAVRTFGDLTITEPVEASVEGERWRALPGEARALLNAYRDDAPVVA